jgi:SAM-dependent methyltransferase
MQEEQGDGEKCMNKPCRICGNTERNKVVFNEFGIDIVRCGSCGHIFSTYDGDQHYDGYFGYAQLSAHEAAPYWDRAHRAMYKDFISRYVRRKQGGALLDVGCGLGYFLKFMKEHAPLWDRAGCEMSPCAVEFAKRELGISEIYCGTIEGSGFRENSFDIITLWDVIEHIPDCSGFLKKIHSLLKEDGILFIHTPNVHLQLLKAKIKVQVRGMKPGMHFLEARDHVNNYSPKTIAFVLRRAGFTNMEFVQLRPIQSVAGSYSRLLVVLKRAWHVLSAVLYRVSFKAINMNNIFVAASKN